MPRQGHIPCKVCGGPSRYLCTTHNEHGSIHRLSNFRCLECGLVFVGDALDEDQLAEAYATLDFDGYYRETEATTGRKLRKAAKSLTRLMPRKDAAILDLGTGNGAFLHHLSRTGYTNLAGHDIPGSDLSSLQQNGVRVYQDFDYSTVPSAAFDAVTLLDVAEHIADPPHLFSEVFRMLRPGGICYLHTPVVSRLDRFMFRVQRLPMVAVVGRLWQRTRTSIFHLQNYTAISLSTLFEKSGFCEHEVRCGNELSWPVRRYVRVYLCEKLGLPHSLAPALALLLYPVVSTNLCHANKAFAWATKPKNAPCPQAAS